MMKILSVLLNSIFWKRVFYDLIYSDFSQDLFNSTDESNFQTICIYNKILF